MYNRLSRRRLEGWRAALIVAWVAAIPGAVGAFASDYSTLRLVKELPGIGGKRMAVLGARVFIQRNASLAIYDFTNVESPSLLGSVSLPTTAEGMQASVTASDNLVALSAYPDDSTAEKVYLVDISTVSAPDVAATMDFRVSCLQLAGNYLYSTGLTAPSFRVYDVSAPATPDLVFSEGTRTLPLENGQPSAATSGAGSVSVKGGYAFVRYGDGRHQVSGQTVLPLLVVWDATNPKALSEIASTPIATEKTYYYPASACVGDTLLFSAFFFGSDTFSKGVTTMNIATPSAPAFLADTQTWDVAHLGQTGSNLYAAPVSGGSCALLIFPGGIVQMDLGDPALPQIRAAYETATNDAAFLGDRVLVLKGDRILELRRAAVGTEFGLDQVSPAQTGVGGVVSFGILGNGFLEGAAATLSHGTDVLAATSIAVSADGKQITADFDLTAAATGDWVLTVTNPGGAQDGLPVTLVAEPLIALTSVTPEQVPAWGEATIELHGSGFSQGMTVQLEHGRWPALTASSVTVDPSGETATVTINASGAYPGWRTLVLTNPTKNRGEFLHAVELVC